MLFVFLIIHLIFFHIHSRREKISERPELQPFPPPSIFGRTWTGSSQEPETVEVEVASEVQEVEMNVEVSEEKRIIADEVKTSREEKGDGDEEQQVQADEEETAEIESDFLQFQSPAPEPTSTLIAQSILWLTFDSAYACPAAITPQLFVGTRDGFLLQYSSNTTDQPINLFAVRRIGRLPVNLFPVDNWWIFILFCFFFYIVFDRNLQWHGERTGQKINKFHIQNSDKNQNNMNLSSMRGCQALLIISDAMWLLFYNVKQEFEVWPLQYLKYTSHSNNNNMQVSYATSFKRMFFFCLK